MPRTDPLRALIMILALAAVLRPGLAGAYSPRDEVFSPTGTALGAEEYPFEALVAVEEDLRDAMISPPSVAAVAPLAVVMLRLDNPPEARASAAAALGRIGHAVAAPSLGAALNDPAPAVRYAAALALGRMPADGAAANLANTLRSDPSWWVRYAAVVALARTRREFIVGVLDESLHLEPKWQIRLFTVRTLEDIGGPRAARAVALTLRDEDSGVRIAAATALGRIGGAAQLDELTAALKAETDPSAHAAQSAALGRLRSRL